MLGGWQSTAYHGSTKEGDREGRGRRGICREWERPRPRGGSGGEWSAANAKADIEQVTSFLRAAQFGSSGDREGYAVRCGLLAMSRGQLLVSWGVGQLLGDRVSILTRGFHMSQHILISHLIQPSGLLCLVSFNFPMKETKLRFQRGEVA